MMASNQSINAKTSKYRQLISHESVDKCIYLQMYMCTGRSQVLVSIPVAAETQTQNRTSIQAQITGTREFKYLQVFVRIVHQVLAGFANSC